MWQTAQTLFCPLPSNFSLLKWKVHKHKTPERAPFCSPIFCKTFNYSFLWEAFLMESKCRPIGEITFHPWQALCSSEWWCREIIFLASWRGLKAIHCLYLPFGSVHVKEFLQSQVLRHLCLSACRLSTKLHVWKAWLREQIKVQSTKGHKSFFPPSPKVRKSA